MASLAARHRDCSWPRLGRGTARALALGARGLGGRPQSASCVVCQPCLVTAAALRMIRGGVSISGSGGAGAGGSRPAGAGVGAGAGGKGMSMNDEA